MATDLLAPHVYRLHRARSGQPWLGRIEGDTPLLVPVKWIFRPSSPPYPWDWAGTPARTGAMAETVLHYCTGSYHTARARRSGCR